MFFLRKTHEDVLVIFITFVYIRTTISNLCIPALHPYTDEEKSFTAFRRKDFSSPSSANYTEIVIDGKNDQIIVGARDHLYVLNGGNLQPKKTIVWKFKKAQQRCMSRYPENFCANHIQMILPFDDKLFICGTNSMEPMYKITQLKDPSIVLQGNKKATEKCSMRVKLKSTGAVTRSGELIAGTYGDKMGSDPMISGSLVFRASNTRPLVRTSKSEKLLNKPEFVDSVSIYPSVYLFFNEIAAERDGEITPTIARICQTDNGGSSFTLEHAWTTYRKARLICTVPGNADMKFTKLENMYWDEETKTFYGIFKTRNESFKGSALCAFNLSEIKRILNGDFLYRKGQNSPWNRVTNPRYFTECTINPRGLNTLSKEDNKSIPNGKQPTNFMTTSALEASYYYQLMYDKAVSKGNIVNFSLPFRGFNQMVVDTIITKGGVKHPVFYIGTDRGRILVVRQSQSQKEACILEEINLFKEGQEEPIAKLALWKNKRKLVVGTNSRLISLTLDSCSRYKIERRCVDARHPACGWSRKKKRCLSWKEIDMKNPSEMKDWIQDLSKCPPKQGTWLPWSQWYTCAQDSEGKFCRCRKRRCSACYDKVCVGDAIQVQNCTATKVLNKTAWLQCGVINGGWSSWSKWSDCDTDYCGSGFRSRTRNCTNPRPANGGLPCVGKDMGCQRCTVKPTKKSQCIYKTIWGTWSNCLCIYEQGKKVHVGVQFRVQSCFSSCGEKRGCSSPKLQNRTCVCGNNVIDPSDPNQVPHTNRAEQIKSTESHPKLKDYQLTDIIVAAVTTGVACILICGLIVTYLVRRNKSIIVSKKLLQNASETDTLVKPSKTPHQNGSPPKAPPDDDGSKDEKELLHPKRKDSVDSCCKETLGDTSKIEISIGDGTEMTTKDKNNLLKVAEKDYEIGMTTF